MVNPVGSFWVTVDKGCDFVPVVSTISNLVALFQKHVILPRLDAESAARSPYYTHLQQKGTWRCAALAIPFLNIVVAIYVFVKERKYDDAAYMKPLILKDSSKIKLASARLRGNEAFMGEILAQYPGLYTDATKELQDNATFMLPLVLKALDPNRFSAIISKFRNNNDFMKAFLAKFPNRYDKLGEELRGDKGFVAAYINALPNDFNFEGFGQDLLNDAVIIKQLIESCPTDKLWLFFNLFPRVPLALKNDPELMRAVHRDEFLFAYAGKELRDNRPFMLEMVEANPLLLRYANGSHALNSDKDVVTAACKKDCRAFGGASAALKDDKEFIMDLIKNKKLPGILPYIPANLQQDPDVQVAVCIAQPDQFSRLFPDAGGSQELFELKKKCVIAILKENCTEEALKRVLGVFNGNEDVMLLVAAKNPDLFGKYAYSGILRDQDFMVRNPHLFRYADKSLKKNENAVRVVYEALSKKYDAEKNNPNSEHSSNNYRFPADLFRDVDESLRLNKDFIMSFIENDPWIVEYLKGGLASDFDVMLLACRKEAMVYQHAGRKIKINRDLVKRLVQANWKVFIHLDDSYNFKQDDDFAEIAYQLAPDDEKEFLLGFTSEDFQEVKRKGSPKQVEDEARTNITAAAASTPH